MKGLYKLAVAFEKASQEVFGPPESPEHLGPMGARDKAPAAAHGPVPSAIDPYIQLSLNKLGYKPELKVDGLLGDETKKGLDWFKRNFGLTPTTSPDLVEKQVRNEAAKLRGKGLTNQLAFKSPGPASEGPVSAATMKGLNDTSSFVNPNSENFTSLK